MTTLGVFRDDFYNAMSTLAQNQYTSFATGGSLTLSAAQMAGAQEVYVNATATGGAVTYTTDTAANIIARLQVAVIAQLQASGNLQQSPGSAVGIPNIFNVSYFLNIANTSAGGTITLAAGTGVTLGTGTNSVAVNTNRGYLVTVTGPNSVTIQTVGSGTN
jgi:hypothetical protein